MPSRADGRARRALVAVALCVVLLLVAATVVLAGRDDEDRAAQPVPAATTTTAPGVSPTVGDSLPGSSSTVVGGASTAETTSTTVAPSGPTAGAADVRAYGARSDGSTNDTAAFAAAFDAAARSKVRWPSGPGGRPQAVVYVPPGTWALEELRFPSDARLEVDAGAVLRFAGVVTREVRAGSAFPKPSSLIVWDGPPGRPVENVSIVGVGVGDGGRKAVAAPVEPGWRIDRSFTMDLDAAYTKSAQRTAGIVLLNVQGFLVENLFSIQNDAVPTADQTRASGGKYPWPTSGRAVLVFRQRNDTPIGGPYYDPRDGVVRNHYNVDSPFGYGPNQVASAHGIRFERVFTRGGTALRLETDSNQSKDFGGEVAGVFAAGIVGVDCNRAVSFAPHSQRNRDVVVVLVQARSCQQGVIESLDEDTPPDERGSFDASTVGVIEVIGGDTAQTPVQGSQGAWTTGRSVKAYARDRGIEWSVRYERATCRGPFAEETSAITLDGREQQPRCE